ncbi:hypothetical protein ACQEVY_30470 [Streptomyces sp. CA-288835]
MGGDGSGERRLLLRGADVPQTGGGPGGRPTGTAMVPWPESAAAHLDHLA